MLFGSLTYCSILLIYCTAVGVCDKVYVVSAKNPGNGLVRGKTMHVVSAQYLLQDRRKCKGTKGLYPEINNTEIDKTYLQFWAIWAVRENFFNLAEVLLSVRSFSYNVMRNKNRKLASLYIAL